MRRLNIFVDHVTNGEKYFFSNDEGRKIIKELSKKRL